MLINVINELKDNLYKSIKSDYVTLPLFRLLYLSLIPKLVNEPICVSMQLPLGFQFK